ncbi:tail fiber protein [Cronobacter phage vB_CsaP_009]|uniref:Putative tail fiber n=1 Tax=Cronobacter phage vB_CsaP_009 TaxID=2699738 RepID=A0A679FGH6_9CAUD|nr:tail fiber protein [Cronobacter phage vB_CsaP_009]BBU72733.1 putative tail fiber [Cronobacter phage vB_CsaP_009]
MSMIYKEGTASLTKGSPVLKGKDTYFLNPIFNVGVGQIVQVKTGDNVYVNSIKEVVDNETLILSFDSISDVKDGEIVIMITMVDSISDTANKLLGMTRGLVQFETEMTKWFTSMDKKIIITLPDGTKKEVYTLQAIMEQVAQNEKEMQELLQNSEKKVNDMVDKAQTDVNNVVTDGTNKINQAVDKADKEINEAITSGTGKIDTMLTESQKKIDKTIEDTEVKVDTELGKIDEKIGNRIDGKVDKTGDTMTGSLITSGYFKSTGGEVNVTGDGATASLMVQDKIPQIVSRIGDGKWIRNQLPTDTGKLMVPGDFGLGASPTSAGIAPPYPLNANEATFNGFYSGGGTNATNYYDKYSPLWTGVRQGGDGSGTVIQYQFGADAKSLAARVRDRNTWSPWYNYMVLNAGGLQKLDGSLVAQNHRIGANPISATKDGVDYLNMYPPKAGGGKDLGFFQYSYSGQFDGQLYIPRPASGSRDHLISSGINPLANRLMTFKPTLDGQAAYIEVQKYDGSQRWRVGSMGNNTNIALTTGGGGSLVLDSDGCIVNGGEVLTNITPNTVRKQNINRNGFYQSQDIEPYNVMFMGMASTHVSNDDYVFSIWGRGNRFLFSTKDAGNWFGTWEVWTTANAKPDTNGFLKKASPILDIFSDGSFSTNEESYGAKVERISTGVYKISEVLGLNSDKSWGGSSGGFEIPIDNNKLPMIWIDYEVEHDGSIILKTYHREHKDVPPFARNLKRGYKDGDPCDIPNGRFVSIRVNMPESSVFNKLEKESSDLIKEMESNPFYKEERAFPNIIFNKKGDL